MTRLALSLPAIGLLAACSVGGAQPPRVNEETINVIERMPMPAPMPANNAVSATFTPAPGLVERTPLLAASEEAGQ